MCVRLVAWHAFSCPEFLPFGLCVLCLGDVSCVSAGKAVAKVVAGVNDNAAEPKFARSKNQLRRIGKLGRMSPKTSHIDDVLAVRRLPEKPGLATCIAALARYRKSGAWQLGHAPGDAYDITKHKEWLSTCRDK